MSNFYSIFVNCSPIFVLIKLSRDLENDIMPTYIVAENEIESTKSSVHAHTVGHKSRLKS